MSTDVVYKLEVPELPLPLADNADVEQLKELGVRVTKAFAAMRDLHQLVLNKLVEEAYEQPRDNWLEDWANEAHERVVKRLFEVGLYSSPWAERLDEYAEILAGAASLLPRFNQVAEMFDALQNEVQVLEEEALNLANVAAEHVEKHPDVRVGKILPPAPVLRVVN